MTSILLINQGLIKERVPIYRVHVPTVEFELDSLGSWWIRWRATMAIALIAVLRRLTPPRRNSRAWQQYQWRKQELKRRAELCRIWRQHRRWR